MRISTKIKGTLILGIPLAIYSGITTNHSTNSESAFNTNSVPSIQKKGDVFSPSATLNTDQVKDERPSDIVNPCQANSAKSDSRITYKRKGMICVETFPPGVSKWYPKGVEMTYRISNDPDFPLVYVSKRIP